LSLSGLENIVFKPGGLIRDWKLSRPDNAAFTLKADQEEAIALDAFVRNRGAAALQVAIDGQPVITVDAGDVFTMNDTIMKTLTIVSAVQYDLLVTGIKLQTLKAMGLVT
jgi:hypothetical protein